MRVTKAHKCYLVVEALQCEEADGIRRVKVVLTPLVHVLVQIGLYNLIAAGFF